ncbi:uncharacterized protein LOC135711639 [Ochlerotatus camptorhynchus]|uniref:uncharacterized protein LOC135711639 n=1 Tax=Ochlerotatus camptorhynchus TaxID=644619 RepID=UPI0031DA67AC
MSRLFGVVLILSAAAMLSLADASLSYGRKITDTFYEATDVQACAAGLSVCIGCKTYRVCIGEPIEEDNPQEMCAADKPYCQIQTGECAITPDNSLAQCESDPPVTTTTTEPTPVMPAFKCTGVGNFPDPYNCAKYYYCVTAGIDGDSYDCPPSQSYNVTSQKCQQMDSGCKPIDCSDSEFIFNEYPTDPQYFYYCKLAGVMQSTLPTVYMFSCGSGAKFDVCTEQCVFGCTQEGLFAKSSDPNKFYQCYMENGTLKYVERSCPGKNQVFDEDVQFCIYQSVTVNRL